MALHIGIEAVGLQHCVAVASDERGKVSYAARHAGEPIVLYSTDRVLIRQRIFNLLKDLSSTLSLRLDDLADSTVCIGMAGASFPSEMYDLEKEFRQSEIQVGTLICRSDTDIILASHLRSTEGSIVLCGAGAAVMVSRHGKVTRNGGWGPAISEYGSGYWIGRQAINTIAHEYVMQGPSSKLWSRINDWLRNPSATEYPDLQLLCIRWLEYLEQHRNLAPIVDQRSMFLAFINHASVENHQAWRCMVSTLSQPVMAAAADGDEQAKAVLSLCVNQLVQQYVECCQIANGGNAALPIVLYGGVLNHHPEMREELKQALRRHFESELLFVTPTSPGTLRPACGALLLALGNSIVGPGPILLPSRQIIRNVEESSRILENNPGGLKND